MENLKLTNNTLLDVIIVSSIILIPAITTLITVIFNNLSKYKKTVTENAENTRKLENLVKELSDKIVLLENENKKLNDDIKTLQNENKQLHIENKTLKETLEKIAH